MPYAHLDDRFYGNPKILSTPLPAVGLYCLGLSYCNAQLTDGFIPRSAVAGWPGWAAAAKMLVARKLWESETDGFRVHDFLEWNPSREQVLAERAAARDRRTRWIARNTSSGTRPEHGTNAEPDASGTPNVIVSRARRTTPPHSTTGVTQVTPGDPLNLPDAAPDEAPPRRGSPREEGTNPRALGTNPRALGTNPRATEAQVCPICRRTFLGLYAEHQCDPLQRPKRRPGLGRLLPREAREPPPPEVLAELAALDRTRADRQATAVRMAQDQA